MEQNNIYQLVFKVTHAGGSGSCFYLKDYDLFVTNYHVVKGFHAVAVHDNDRNPYLAKVVLVNPSLDIALLSVDGDFSALPSLNLAGDNSLSIGGKVCVAGYPYGMPFTVIVKVTRPCTVLTKDATSSLSGRGVLSSVE